MKKGEITQLESVQSPPLAEENKLIVADIERRIEDNTRFLKELEDAQREMLNNEDLTEIQREEIAAHFNGSIMSIETMNRELVHFKGKFIQVTGHFNRLHEQNKEFLEEFKKHKT